MVFLNFCLWNNILDCSFNSCLRNIFMWFWINSHPEGLKNFWLRTKTQGLCFSPKMLSSWRNGEERECWWHYQGMAWSLSLSIQRMLCLVHTSTKKLLSYNTEEACLFVCFLWQRVLLCHLDWPRTYSLIVSASRECNKLNTFRSKDQNFQKTEKNYH